MDNAKRQGWSKSRALLPCCLVALALCTFLLEMKEASFLRNSSRTNNANKSQQQVAEAEPVITKTSSLFEKMHKQLHQFAAAPNHYVEKKKYEIGVSMDRGTGGLLDSDRTLLSDIYSSVDSVFEFGLGESSKMNVITVPSRVVIYCKLLLDHLQQAFVPILSPFVDKTTQ